MVKGGTRPYRDLILRDRLGHAGVKVKWEPVEARQLEHSEPSLALGFLFMHANAQLMRWANACHMTVPGSDPAACTLLRD